MRFISIACAALIAAVPAAGPAWAQGTTKQSPAAKRATGGAAAVFTDIEKRIIDEYYRLKARVTAGDPPSASPAGAPRRASGVTRGLPRNAGKKPAEDDDAGQGKAKAKPEEPPPAVKKDAPPPGLAKKDQLPPGLAKRDRLPPGLQRDRLPADLVAKLPAPRRGTERVLIGDDLVLIDQKTQVVLDILRGAAQPRS
ncbi:MAG: RcnB family protein [Alphaproteobacteria bacterium]|nr:RcnB family protein [Alphaproteobacteria bacterium]